MYQRLRPSLERTRPPVETTLRDLLVVSGHDRDRAAPFDLLRSSYPCYNAHNLPNGGRVRIVADPCAAIEG